MAEKTPTSAQLAQIKDYSSKIATVDAEIKKLESAEYQKGKTDAELDAEQAHYEDLYKQKARLQDDQGKLAQEAFGAEQSSQKIVMTDGTEIWVPGTGKSVDSSVPNIGGTVNSSNKKASDDLAAKDWDDNEVKAQTSGPSSTRTESSVVTTGGGERVTSMTPEYRDWIDKSNAAAQADSKATAAAKEEYLRSQGLDQASPAARRAALRDAEANGTNFTVTSNKDALGEPPKNQYTDQTIPTNPTGVQKPNDGEQTADQSAKDSAAGQTAEAKIDNDSTKYNPGTGTGTPSPEEGAQPLTDDQVARLESKQGNITDTAENSAAPAAPKSESTFASEPASAAPGSVSGLYVSSNSNTFAQSAPEPIPYNILHDFASYTYRITLFLLTKKDYNALASDPSTFVPKYSLISSAGGFANEKGSPAFTVKIPETNDYWESPSTRRHPDFQTDFFIDNLNLTTVVGLNAKSKASNAVEITFSITEPYGLSLLDRLLSAVETSGDNSSNYMEQPYLLQVDILSSPTDEKIAGTTSSVISSKKIAIKLIDMKIRPTGSGTVYNIQAIPYNHTAFSMSVAAVPVPMSIEASTVGEFFGSKMDMARLFTNAPIDQNRVEADLKIYVDEVTNVGGIPPTPEEIENRRTALKNAYIYDSKSFTAAYNNHMETVSKTQKLSDLPPTKIAFNIVSDELAKSPIVGENSQSSDTAFNDQKRGVGNKANSQYKKTQSFPVKEGTSIVEVIDQVLGKSEYLKKQINSQNKENNTQEADKKYKDKKERTDDKKTPVKLQWYKVVPTVALGDFDPARNAYSKVVLYTIMPYSSANAYHPNFAKITSSDLENSVVREYNYLYTGKNKDILKLDIDFDSSFFTQITTFRNQVARLGSNRFNNPNQQGYSPDEFSTGQVAQSTSPPSTIQVVGSNANSNSMNTATNPEEKIIADLKTSIYTSTRGDMLNIKLQIIGDPAWIKQDDVYYNPGSPEVYKKQTETITRGGETIPINPFGQVIFDSGQVYVKLNVRNAVDINDDKGIVNKQDLLQNGKYTNGTFSGVYKVMTVQSSFSRGQFTQTLDLIRMPDRLPPPPTLISEEVTKAQAASHTDSSDFVGKPKPRINQIGTSDFPSGSTPALESAANEPPVTDEQTVTPQESKDVSFSDAFAQARKDYGNRPGGSFEWHGKMYQTNYKTEDYVANPTPVYPGANE